MPAPTTTPHSIILRAFTRLAPRVGLRSAPPLLSRFSSSNSLDPWATLGVPRTADLDECKAAFRALALTLHPDVSADAAKDAERFAAVVEAYEAIEQGRAVRAHTGRGGPRGVRSVGGVLVVSIEALKSDPAYEVHTMRIRFEDESATGDAARAAPSNSNIAGGDALSTETIREVFTSEWDSVADLRMLLQAELGLPERLRHGGRQRGGGQHELIYKGQLLGEHLFLGPDYAIADGDIVHFAAAREAGAGASASTK